MLAHDAAKGVNRTALLEFLGHGLRYAFPAKSGTLSRGVPTAYAAEPLRSALQQGDDPPPVWPYVEGMVRGYTLTPLYKRAALAALADPKLYELLSLADALRGGRVRERKTCHRNAEGKNRRSVIATWSFKPSDELLS